MQEYLEGFSSLRDRFVRGNLEVDNERQIGTVMGRSHARTHASLVPADKRSMYLQSFHNTDQRLYWQRRHINFLYC